MESIFELWGKREPYWEKRYQDTVIGVFSDYGKGNTQYQGIRGKSFGAGYEMFIVAYFIGLYFNQVKPLVEDTGKVKKFGHAIQYWGSIEERNNRKQYPQIREFIFASLVAKTDIDWIALDKGEMTSRSVVDKLIEKMEEYANFGFDYIEDRLRENPNYYFQELGFMKTFLKFFQKDNEDELGGDEPDTLDEPDSLDDVQSAVDAFMAPKVTSVQDEEIKNQHWYKDEIDFEVKAYRKGFEFWNNCAQILSTQGILDVNDCAFLRNMANLMSRDKLLSEKQMAKLYKVVQSAEKIGFDFTSVAE